MFDVTNLSLEDLIELLVEVSEEIQRRHNEDEH